MVSLRAKESNRFHKSKSSSKLYCLNSYKNLGSRRLVKGGDLKKGNAQNNGCANVKISQEACSQLKITAVKLKRKCKLRDLYYNKSRKRKE